MGSRTPPLGDPPIEERKLATILFADLVGSTELGAEQDPERTRLLLDRFYDAMASEIEAAGGTVEKFIGDAVVAVFGAPAALEDHAERALHAALAMLRRLDEIFGERLSLRIGVNSGEVALGRAREGSSFVTGDAVNVAARLEQAAEPGEVLVGERTARAVRGAFEFAAPTTVEAKGKPQGVPCRRLLRALSLMRPRGIGGLGLAFVGRNTEFEQLQGAYDRVAEERRPQLVTVLGEAGVGKTRLVREFWLWLGALSPEPLRRTGRCQPQGRATTYWPLGEVLREHFGMSERDDPDSVLARLGSRETLGLTLGLDVAAGIHPLLARDRLHDAWAEFLMDLADEQPAVILLEDLHWGNNDLLDLLESLLEGVHGPMLLLCTARPELLDQRPGWGGARRAGSTVMLEPLSRADSSHLVQLLLGSDIPPQLDGVVDLGEGNPFFIEELLAALIDRDLLASADGGWTLRALPAGLELPDSVQALLSARIDLLGADEKATLQAASVIGRSFWTGPIYELLPEAAPDFRVLEDRGFVRRRAGSSIPGETEFVFKHQLTREVAYAGLPKASRARLHAQFAAWLERLGGGDTHAQQLAHHYFESVRPEDADLLWLGHVDEAERLQAKALVWLRRAAERAVAGYAIDDALELLHKALSLGPSEAEQAELWHAIGQASVLKFDGEGFWSAMLRAADLCREPERLADIYAELAIETATRSGMWRSRPPNDAFDGWIEQALELAPRESAARAKALAAYSYVHAGAEDAAREAFEIAERRDDVELRSLAVEGLTATATAALDFQSASEWAELRLDLVEGIADPDHRSEALLTAICAYVAVGRFPDAQRLAALLREVSAELTPHHRLHAVGYTMLVDSLAGRWGSIRGQAQRAAQAVDENIDTPCLLNNWTLLACATAHAHVGELAEAQRFDELADELPREAASVTVRTAEIWLELARGDLGAVAALLPDEPPPRGGRPPNTAFQLSVRLDALAALRDRERIEAETPALVRPGTYLEPFALRARGVVREKRELLEQAAASFDAMNLEWHAEQTRALARIT